ncbi:hypothetical protein IQ268_10890 [Oculatella sp. LEGE 06141]|uniref:hypothetical protein n=1 Tax=Oculatella sp. LEGE 06141 TaxID=1828648 RepID=UPI00187EDC7C|nr:hypothetical protein [Oculatella sp. LEGE 06141]MBE9179067.1 hypothetical protein [Oculatella sp. LEGE 06141]
MVESNSLGDGGQNQSAVSERSVPAREAFVSTRKAFTDLEAAGITDFQIFNALADLFHERKMPDVSELMAEAAYRCFERE